MASLTGSGTRYRPQHQRRHFVFLLACGCPYGLIEEGPRVDTEKAAWRDIYGSARAQRAARAAGVRVEHVDHATYERELYPRMTLDCPHSSQKGSADG